MKKTIIFSVFLLGLTSVIAQLTIIREATINFYGNEFFIGWVIFSWLFWTGCGSLILSRFLHSKNGVNLLILCHLFIGIFLMLALPLIRTNNQILKNPAGQIADLIPALIYVFFVVAPLCLFLGLQFYSATRLWNEFIGKEKTEKIIGKSYFWETLGFVLGGLIFTYFLVFFNELDLMLILSWINIICGAFLVFNARKKFILKFITIFLIFSASVCLIASGQIDKQTKSLRFPNQELVETKNSFYGNIAVTKIKNQYSLYESGLLLSTGEESPQTQLIHIPLLYHQNPKHILLIGNGLNGTINEILKHDPEKIDYLEIDPMLISIAEKYLPPEIKNGIFDRRVKIINLDARNFIKITQEKFDIIAVILPNPSTALLNRFYTQDFFQLAKDKLNPQGIFTISTSSMHNYLGPETENLDVSIFNALKKSFPYVLSLPEENNLFIAGKNDLKLDAQEIIARLEQRKIENTFVNQAYILNRLNNDRVQKFILAAEKKQHLNNRDQLPKSYYYNFVYWISAFYPEWAKLFLIFAQIKFYWLIGLFILISTLIIVLLKKGQKEKNTIFLPLIMACSGLSLMAAEIIILLGFQVFYGNLYYKIASIITMLMAGLAIGSYFSIEKIDKAKAKNITQISALIILFFLAMLVGFYALFNNSFRPSSFVELIFNLGAMIIGLLVGWQFPLINKFYLLNLKNAGKKTGIIYGADLFGSCCGAFFFSVFLIPLFGIYAAIFLLITLNVFALTMAILHSLHQKPGP